MRKLKLTGSVLLVVFMMFLMASCGGPKTPSEVAVTATECAADGDVDGIIDRMATPPGMEINDEMRKQFKEMFEGEIKAELDEKGGLESVEAIEETISEDGQTAKVKIKMVYGNGEDETQTMHLVKEDDEWKIEFR